MSLCICTSYAVEKDGQSTSHPPCISMFKGHNPQSSLDFPLKCISNRKDSSPLCQMHVLKREYFVETNAFVCLSLRLLRLLLFPCLVVFNGLQNTAMMLIRIIIRLLNIGFYSFMIDCPPHSTPCALESRESSSLLNLDSARQCGTQPDIPLSSIFNAMDFV